ncbi:hypothetical protein A244_15002 [Pseudomonas syringae pv. actinidiae ICMP 18807]|uniref:Uncharacterized protein n=1 Tax=Pseudomonas syringae pv. actinidiae ICMP 18807 TaxID=1194404 RepID=S6UJ73_PSESF|nr:hypothetical protein A244_15002 [Pseudomonas syringae pv. actinidiae ICMP 18807]
MVLHSDIGLDIEQYSVVDSDSSASQALNNRVIDNRVGLIPYQTSVRILGRRTVSNVKTIQITNNVTALVDKNFPSRRKDTLPPTTRRCEPMQIGINQMQLTPKPYRNTYL